MSPVTMSRGETSPCVCKLISQSAVNARRGQYDMNITFIHVFVLFFFPFGQGITDVELCDAAPLIRTPL